MRGWNAPLRWSAKVWFACFLYFGGSAKAQELSSDRADRLRGSVTPEREWWDLQFYHLTVKVEPDQKRIEGSNLIRYRVINPGKSLQIDLQEPLEIYRILQDGVEIPFRREGNAWFVEPKKAQVAGSVEEMTVDYGGIPREAVRPPWEGGFQWTKDSRNKWFAATSCQGVGASVWWPCKDHMYDEPDSMRISLSVPTGLQAVSNGRLLKVDSLSDGITTFHWGVQNPINNYGVNANIADYRSWKEVFQGEAGNLDITYFVLPQNFEKAKKQFRQVPMMLKAFEHWFGPYPFYEDGFKLVEVPYLGMEHQSSVTYGNKFENGYLGRDLSGTGWGLKFDFIIVHESGHEWFANNITYRDIADMWIHESFTSYSEALYLEYHYGKMAASEYVIGVRRTILNQAKIMGVFGLNQRGSGDMYPKGSNMLHTIRQVIDNDSLWREVLRGLNKTFYHQTVTGADIINYVNNRVGKNLSLIFKQYLEDIRIPELEYFFKDKTLYYRWSKVIQGFDMPVKVKLGDSETWLSPVAETWRSVEASDPVLIPSPDFYITSKEVKM